MDTDGNGYEHFLNIISFSKMDARIAYLIEFTVSALAFWSE